VARLRDHERASLANDPLRFAQDHLDLARVALVSRQLACLLGGLVVVDSHDPPLRLRDGLLRDDDDVVVLERREPGD